MKDVQNIYSIIDTVAEQAGPLFLANNDAVALRMLKNFVKENPHSDYTDFSLITVGSFDTVKYILTPLAEGYRVIKVPRIGQEEETDNAWTV